MLAERGSSALHVFRCWSVNLVFHLLLLVVLLCYLVVYLLNNTTQMQFSMWRCFRYKFLPDCSWVDKVTWLMLVLFRNTRMWNLPDNTRCSQVCEWALLAGHISSRVLRQVNSSFLGRWWQRLWITIHKLQLLVLGWRCCSSTRAVVVDRFVVTIFHFKFFFTTFTVMSLHNAV